MQATWPAARRFLPGFSSLVAGGNCAEALQRVEAAPVFRCTISIVALRQSQRASRIAGSDRARHTWKLSGADLSTSPRPAPHLCRAVGSYRVRFEIGRAHV